MDKSWIQLGNRRLPEYIDGVRNFIKFASDHLKPGVVKIWCPCNRCNNRTQRTIEEVEIHLFAYGVVMSYTRWVYHGEDFDQNNDGDDETNIEDVNEVENSPENEVQEIIHDVAIAAFATDYVDEAFISHGSNLSSNEENKFIRLLRDSEKELYPGCERFSKLSFVVKLLHHKILNRQTNKSFTMLLKLLKEAFPAGETLPCYYNEAKQIIHDLGLSYEKIHICKNHCILYRKEYEDLESCPHCQTPRYKFHKGKCKKVPHKVLRYLPVKPRLQRLYVCKDVASDMMWHKDKRVEEPNKLRHPADAEAWKDFDEKHKSFAKDPRNVRLGLATDGFNPFGSMSNTYSIWPVFLVAYNLPPWKCMKNPFIMMPLLIPGRRAPGFNIDVFLQPLIDDLKKLWEVGVETYDSVSGQNFQLRAALLWTINDFPAYGNLSAWSTKGKLACPSSNENASSEYLHNWRKTCYRGHRPFLPRRFLPGNHPLRRSKVFSDELEHKEAPKFLSGDEILGRVDHIEPSIFGKVDERGKKRKRAPIYLNWTRRTIFFELPYWKTLKIRHNLDIMHIVKNIDLTGYGLQS